MNVVTKLKNYLHNKKEDKIVALMVVSASASAYAETVYAAEGEITGNEASFGDWLEGVVGALGWIVALVGVAMLAYAIINHTADNYSKCIFMIIGGGLMIAAPKVIKMITGKDENGN